MYNVVVQAPTHPVTLETFCLRDIFSSRKLHFCLDPTHVGTESCVKYAITVVHERHLTLRDEYMHISYIFRFSQ